MNLGLTAAVSASTGGSSGTDLGGSFLGCVAGSSADTEAWTSALASLAESAEFEAACTQKSCNQTSAKHKGKKYCNFLGKQTHKKVLTRWVVAVVV